MVLTQNTHEIKREVSQIEHESSITSVEIQELKKEIELLKQQLNK